MLPPAAMGSVYQAAMAGYTLIGIVDGVFGNVPSVWHKEILFAMAHGAIVAGAGSMGALRAAELWQYGMVGLGRTYRLYRRGALADDDEVCLLHGPEEFHYAPASEPMINVRFTARRLRRAHLLSATEERAFLEETKGVFFGGRTRTCVLTILQSCVAQDRADLVATAFCEAYYDVKATDARWLLTWMQGGAQKQWTKPSWDFPQTHHWRDHFEGRQEPSCL